MKHKIPKKVRKAMKDCAEYILSDADPYWGSTSEAYEIQEYLARIANDEAAHEYQKILDMKNPPDDSEDFKIHVSREKLDVEAKDPFCRLWIPLPAPKDNDL